MSPDDPLLPEIVEAQSADANLSTLILAYQKRPDGESNPALPAGSPLGRSHDSYSMQGGIHYIQGRISIPPTSHSLILKILRQYHDAPMAGHFGVARTQALVP